MARMFEIPIRPSQAQIFTITLNRTEYRFDLRWNTVGVYWVLDIYDVATDTPLLRGVPLVTGVDLLAQYEYMAFNGDLVVVTIAQGSTVSDEVPGFDDMGKDGHLYFLTV